MSHCDRDWMIPAGIILSIALLAWFVLFNAGLAHAPLIAAYELLACAVIAPVLCYRLIGSLRRRPAPFVQLLQDARDEPSRIVAVVIGMQLFALGAALFGALKAAIPKAIPFWLDNPLAEAERRLFGLDPWQISHRLLGWATPAIDLVYATFLPGHLIAVFAMLTAAPSARKTQAIISLFLSWLIVGVGAAYALSSAGPIFYDRAFGGDRFATLTEVLRGVAPFAVRTSDLMWQFHAGDTPVIATGISAMPSMHVGMTLWLVLIARGTRYARPAWIYFALIWLGSVHLGWHYVSDGLVGSVAVAALWSITGTFQRRSSRGSGRSTLPKPRNGLKADIRPGDIEVPRRAR